MFPFPSLIMAGAAGAACTWDPDNINPDSHRFSSGSLDATKLVLTTNGACADIGTVSKASSKFYFEVLVTGSGSFGGVAGIGLTPAPIGQLSWNQIGKSSGRGVGYFADGSVWGADTFGHIAAHAPAWSYGDIIQIAVDLTNHLWWPGKNNTFVGNPVAGTGGLALLNTAYFPGGSADTGGATQSLTGRFSSSSFAYTPPVGFAQWR